MLRFIFALPAISGSGKSRLLGDSLLFADAFKFDGEALRCVSSAASIMPSFLRKTSLCTTPRFSESNLYKPNKN